MATRNTKQSIPTKRRLEVVKELNAYITDVHKCQVLEEAMYNYSLQVLNEVRTSINVDFVKDDVSDPMMATIYEDKFIEIMANVDPTVEVPNPYFVMVVNSMTDEQIKEIPSWKQPQMFPEYWQKEVEKMDKELMMKNTVKTTDLHTCRKCGQNKITFYMKQTRAADEPITTFYKCQVCGNGWKTN